MGKQVTGDGRNYKAVIEFYPKENEGALKSDIIRFELLKTSSACTWRLLTNNACLLH